MQEQNNEKPWPLGFGLSARVPGPTDEWLARFRDIPAAWVSDSLGRTCSSLGLNAYHNDVGLVMVGRAITVRVRPGDSLMIHKAIEIAHKDDVIVVDGGADPCFALVGGNMRQAAIRKGLAGFVVDGSIRDLSDWAKGGMPIWARSPSLRAPTKVGPGEINVSIACAGLVVNPGDLIIGDADGVVAVSPSILDVLWPAIQKTKEWEENTQRNSISGNVDPEAINSILRKNGCPV